MPPPPAAPEGSPGADDPADDPGPADADGRRDRFESVDWAAVADDGGASSARGRLAAVGTVALAAALAAPALAAVPTGPTDWLLAAGLAVGGGGTALSVARDPERWRRRWRRFRANRLAVVALAYLLAFVAVGALGPLVASEPEPRVLLRSQPPVGGSVDADLLADCAGRVVDGRCRGSWRFPLGTTAFDGKSLLPLVVLGARTSLAVGVGAATLVAPVGVAVGVAAAAAGGRIDRLLMGAAEALRALPAIVVYGLAFWLLVEGRLLVLVAAFGAVAWGGIARLVRDQLVAERSRTYAQAAVVGGVGRRRLLVRHLLPNVSPAVLTALTLQVPLFVLTEAAVSFVRIRTANGSLTFGDPSRESWGQLIYAGLLDAGFPTAWWTAGVPLALLTATAVAFNLVGDALADAFDPRER